MHNTMHLMNPPLILFTFAVFFLWILEKKSEIYCITWIMTASIEYEILCVYIVRCKDDSVSLKKKNRKFVWARFSCCLLFLCIKKENKKKELYSVTWIVTASFEYYIVCVYIVGCKDEWVWKKKKNRKFVWAWIRHRYCSFVTGYN